jgi:RNA polymerase sigma-70 factor, ECF subfamily
MGPSDNDLWSRARSGDADAFALLFERHARCLYNYCYRRVGDWSAAEDLLSVTFLEAWRHRRANLEEGKVLPWLYGIANNIVRNRRRSERRYRAALSRMPQPGPEPDFAEASQGRIDEERRVERALTLVAQLPRQEHEVFVLCGWMGLEYQDAAFALDIPLGTVRSRLSRARRRLRELDLASGHKEDRSPTVQEALEQ